MPAEYPFKPPAFVMLTPSGRFETGTKICLSISSFHPESWQPSWSVRSALIALIAFMQTPGNGAVGSLETASDVRRQMAIEARNTPPKHANLERQELITSLHQRMLEMEEQSKSLYGLSSGSIGSINNNNVVNGDEGGEAEGGDTNNSGGGDAKDKMTDDGVDVQQQPLSGVEEEEESEPSANTMHVPPSAKENVCDGCETLLESGRRSVLPGPAPPGDRNHLQNGTSGSSDSAQRSAAASAVAAMESSAASSSGSRCDPGQVSPGGHSRMRRRVSAKENACTSGSSDSAQRSAAASAVAAAAPSSSGAGSTNATATTPPNAPLPSTPDALPTGATIITTPTPTAPPQIEAHHRHQQQQLFMHDHLTASTTTPTITTTSTPLSPPILAATSSSWEDRGLTYLAVLLISLLMAVLLRRVVSAFSPSNNFENNLLFSVTPPSDIDMEL